MTPWEIEGRELVNCNCAYGCPCQFNARPTHGFCEAIGTFAIDRGHYGDVTLDGLRAAMIVHWPGAVHEGNGQMQPVLDAAGDERQRGALLKILSGEDTEPFATVFAVFATTFDRVFEPIVAPIEFEVDLDGRTGTVRVADVLEIAARPIRNPKTGRAHRARIELPEGFEYEVAEIGSGSCRSRAAIALDLHDTYAQFARLHLNNHGVVRGRAAAR